MSTAMRHIIQLYKDDRNHAAVDLAAVLSGADPVIVANAVFKLGLLRRSEGNFHQAIWLFRAAADAGNSSALLALSLMYEAGVPTIPKDEQKAERYLQLSAQLGNPAALNNVAHDVERKGGRYAAERATELLKRAAEGGLPKAQFHLAVHYARGHGTARDSLAAAQMLNRAAAGGHREARRALAVSLLTGSSQFGIAQDVRGAAEMLQAAAPHDMTAALAYNRLRAV